MIAAGTSVGMWLSGAYAWQSPADLTAWEAFLARHRVGGILEVGTATGAFSRWLAERVPVVVTADVERPDKPPARFMERDIFEDPIDLSAPELRGLHPLLLFCDNGDKPREVALYAPSLRLGDYLAVHDYGDEIFAWDIPGGFRPVLPHRCERLGSLTRFYRRTDQRL